MRTFLIKPHSQSPFLGPLVGLLGGTYGCLPVGMVLQCKLPFLLGFPVLWDSDSVCPVGSPPFLGALLKESMPAHRITTRFPILRMEGLLVIGKVGGVFMLSVQKDSSVQLPSGNETDPASSDFRVNELERGDFKRKRLLCQHVGPTRLHGDEA